MEKIVILSQQKNLDPYEYFPFLFGVKKLWPESELNFVHHLDYSKAFGHLPFKVKTHLLKEEVMGAIQSVKWAHQMDDLFNITYFFNFREGMGSLNFGKTLNPKNFVGFKTMMNTLYLTQAIERPLDLTPDRENLSLLKDLTEEDLDFSSIQLEEKYTRYENFFKAKEEGPFLFLPLRPLAETEFLFLKEMLSMLNEQERVILWSEAEDEHFMDLINFRPSIISAMGVDYAHLPKYMGLSKGVLTNWSWAARLCHICGVENFYFSEEKEKLSSLHYFDRTQVVQILDDSKEIDTIFKTFNL